MPAALAACGCLRPCAFSCLQVYFPLLIFSPRWQSAEFANIKTALGCTQGRSMFDKLVDGGISPAGCRASNFQFEPWRFRLYRNHRICRLLRLRPPLTVFARASTRHKKLQGNGFALENGISRRKNCPVPAVHEAILPIPNRQNQSAFAGLKT